MTAIEKAVAAKLAAQRSGEDAAALWQELWAAYQSAGPEGVQALLDDLLDLPGESEAGEDA